MLPEVGRWDQFQKAVIFAEAGRRIIVDAGPGTGKTDVACARLAALIAESEVAVSRILMISFTRTAVAEIRARLYSYIGEEAFSVKLGTIDSHAWAIHSGFDAGAKLAGSYEQNIKAVFALVDEDPDVAEYLERLEHVVVDEAQDLVGIRGQLMEAIIGRLDPVCGVTMFADEAQAIYGFSEEATIPGKPAGPNMLNRLRSRASLRFEAMQLETIHRTKSPGLQSIFRDVRRKVISGSGVAENHFADVRDLILEYADEQGLHATNLGLESLEPGSLVLFRTRAETLHISQFNPLPHGLRLSGYGACLPAWLGACFFDLSDLVLGQRGFLDLWQDRIEGQCHSDDSPGDAWEKLLSLGGQADGSVSMPRLRRQLSRSPPPLELASLEFGLPGPILGTIHASKGREAENVTLLVPQRSKFKDAADEAEETRILFVGATRAKNWLRVGRAMKYRGASVASGRAYRNVNGNAMVEIGREADLSAEGLVGQNVMSQAACRLAQKRLVRTNGVMTELTLEQDPNRDWRYRIQGSEVPKYLGLMSKSMNKDLWNVGENLGGPGGAKLGPGRTVRYVRSFGTRTIVIPEDSAEAASLHYPWSRSGFVLAPKIAAFTMIYYSRNGNGN